MQVWRADAKDQTLMKETTPSSWIRLGGRGLIAQILVDEVPPTCDPMGRHNKLILAPGLLVGHMLSSCDRISFGAKSPLTGGIKESNAGGSTGLQLTHLGIKALIIENAPQTSELFVLRLNADGGSFEPASDLIGQGAYHSAEKLRSRYGPKVAIALIGPGGEMRMLSAGIQNLDKDGVPSRIAARGGLGAVMAAKGLKAIVIDSLDGKKPEIKDEKAFKDAQKKLNKAIQDHPQTEVYADFGTAAMVAMCNGFGALPTRNFSDGYFEGAESVSGEAMRPIILAREGEGDTTHACMAGCTIQCSNVYAGNDGKTIVSPIEYETIGLMGSNLSIADLDTIARFNWQLNDLGIDSIEVGAALGVAADAGVWEFGDHEAIMKLLDEIRTGSPLGRVLGNGAVVTGRTFGVRRVPAVKGQAMSAYDPRAIKGTGVTYATSPQGADHTCGLTIRAKIDHLGVEGQVDTSLAGQIKTAGYDTLGVCAMATFGFSLTQESIGELLRARYGWDVSEDILTELGRKTIDLELAFNRSAGFSSNDDRIPEWMREEPLPPHNAVFDVPDTDLDSIFQT